jgi:hypothetical protein
MVALYSFMVMLTRPNHSAVHLRSDHQFRGLAARRLKTSSAASSSVGACVPTSDDVKRFAEAFPAGLVNISLIPPVEPVFPPQATIPALPCRLLPACSQAHGIQPQLHPGGARLSTASPSKGVCSGCTILYRTSRPRAAPAAPALRIAIAHAAFGATARTGLRRPYTLQLPGPMRKTRRTTRWAEDATRVVTIGFAARPAHKTGGIDRWPQVKSSRDRCAVTQAQAAHPHPLPSHGDDVGRARAAHTLAAVLPCLGCAPRPAWSLWPRRCSAHRWRACVYGTAHSSDLRSRTRVRLRKVIDRTRKLWGRQRARQRSARYRADRDAGARMSAARLEVAGTGRAPF